MCLSKRQVIRKCQKNKGFAGVIAGAALLVGLLNEVSQASLAVHPTIPYQLQYATNQPSFNIQQSVVAPGLTWPPRIVNGTATLPLAIASDPTLAEAYPYATLYGIEVSVGETPLQFVVDTGASNSVISERVAETLGIPSTPIPHERIESFVVGEQCADQQLNLYQLPKIVAAQAEVDGIVALGLPFSTNPTQTTGVLGMDFLSAFDISLDPSSEVITLHSPSHPDPNAIQLTGQIGLMTANVAINSSGSFPFMLDTGAALTVLSQNLVDRIHLDLSQAQPVDVIGFCGTETGLYMRLSQVALSGYAVQDLDVIILDSPVLSELNVDGILGQNFLTRYHQHWRFGEPDAQGFPGSGSLELSPVHH